MNREYPAVLSRLNVPFVRFIFVGMARTLLGFVYYNILLLFIAYPYAVTLSYIVGIFSSYILNTFLVFRQPPKLRKALKFPLVYAAQYLLNLMIVSLSVEHFGVHERLAYAIGLLISVPATFLLSRAIIAPSGGRANSDVSV